MNDRLPELKEEMEKISVPVDKLDHIIRNTMKENRQPKKNSKKRIVIYSSSAAVLALGLLTGSAFVSPAMAKVVSQIPVIGSIFSFAGDEGLQTASKQGLASPVNQTVKDNGITLSIKDVFYDGTRLSLGYSHESLVSLGEVEQPDIQVNGKAINFSSSSSGKFISPQHYAGILDINPTEELPEEFIMKVTFSKVGLITGKWEFEFPVKQSNDVVIIRPMETKIFGNEEVKLKSLKVGPVGTDLSIDVLKPQDKQDLNFHFNVIDEKGNALTQLSGGGQGNIVNGNDLSHLEFQYPPLKEGMKNVTVIPYTLPETNGLPPKVSKSLQNENLPITLNQGELGRIVVTDIKYMEDKTVVYFKVESDFAFDGNFNHNRIWLEDHKGRDLTLDGKPYAERVEGNFYKQEFKPVNDKKNTKVVTREFPEPVMYEGFKVQLP